MRPEPPAGSIGDILHEFLSGASQRSGAPFAEPDQVLRRSARLARRQFLRGALQPRAGRLRLQAGQIWAVSTTLNQVESLQPVSAAAQNADWSGLRHVPILDPFTDWGSPLSRAALRALPQAVRAMEALPKAALALVADLPGLLATCHAESALFRRSAMRARPSALLLSNDHSPRNRSLFAAARHLDVPRIYLQHAAVGGIERPLDMDLALLHGQHARNIYAAIGPIRAEVALIGSPKIDAVRRITAEHAEPPETITFFPGLFDAPDAVARVAECLATVFPHAQRQLRLHPRDERDGWRAVPDRLLARRPRSETAMDALRACDMAVFDDSNIGLEAAALGRATLCVPFSDVRRDQYALESTGLFAMCRAEPDTLVQTALSVASGEARPDQDALNHIFAGWSSGRVDADQAAVRRLRAFKAHTT